MSFVNELFPLPLSKDSSQGPTMNLSVTESDAGGQERADRWPSYRWEYDAGIGIRNFATANGNAGLDSVQQHWICVGPKNSFPIEDPRDFTSQADGRTAPTTTPGSALDQVIAVGDDNGSNTGTKLFQLIKTYTFGGRSYIRNIRKPQSGTVTVSVAGTLQTLGTHYSLDTSTGQILFVTAPLSGQQIRASFKFYVPVLYGAPFELKVAMAAVQAGRVATLPLVEDISAGALTPDFGYGGGGDTITVSSNLLYDYNWGRCPAFSPTADGFSITLPDINEIPFGGPWFTFTNLQVSGPKTITFRNRATAASEFTLPIAKGYFVCVRKDTGGVRQWTAVGA